MTNAEMHAIQVHNAPVFLKRTLAPRFKLLRECLVEATDRTGTGSDSQQRLGNFPHFELIRKPCDTMKEKQTKMGEVRDGTNTTVGSQRCIMGADPPTDSRTAASSKGRPPSQ